MKSIIQFVVLPLAVLLIYHFLTKETIDLRYTISEKIPTKLINSSATEVVQQLVVKNNGKLPAEKIQIKVNGAIEKYDILKSSVSDQIEEYNSADYFEATYPSLSPGTQFSYIFKTTGIGITQNNIEVIHSRGKAVEAFSSHDSSIIGALNSFMFLFYILFILMQLRSFAVERIESRGKYQDFYEYLNQTKPFYVTQNKWRSTRIEYIKNKSRVETFFSFDNIEGLESYKIINQDKPSYLSGDEWDLLKDSATKSLTNSFMHFVNTNNYYQYALKYLVVKKPTNFPQNQWKEIVKKTNEHYIMLRKIDIGLFLREEDILEELNEGIPSGMSKSHRKEYEGYLLEEYYRIISTKTLSQLDPLNYLETKELSMLNKENKMALQNLAYNIQLNNFGGIYSSHEAQKFVNEDKPKWLSETDTKNFEEQSEAHIALETSISKYQGLLSTFNEIINQRALKEKPDINIDDDEWGKIKKIEKKVSTAAKKNETDRVQHEKEKEKIQELKNKILKQLQIINDVISEPQSIEKIEPYDIPFSEGNFKNLKKLAYLLKTQGGDNK